MHLQFVVTLIGVCCLINASPFLIPRARCFRVPADIKTTAILQGIQSSQELDSQRDSTLTLTKIAEFIDSTFVDSCFQLSKGFVDVLKLFIVSVKAGYEMGVTTDELILQADAVNPKKAGRELFLEEFMLRNTWIHAIYLVLSDSHHNTQDPLVSLSIDQNLVSRYAPNVPILKKQREDGLEFRVENLGSAITMIEDPSELVIAKYTLRVMWLTLVVLEEENRCNTEFARQDAPMRPQIPGAFKEENLNEQ